MKLLRFFSLFIFLLYQILLSSFHSLLELVVPPELKFKILHNCSLYTVLNYRATNTKNHAFSNDVLKKIYLNNQRSAHLFWKIFIEPEKEDIVPTFIGKFCLENFDKMAPEIMSHYSFLKIKNKLHHPNFRVTHASKDNCSFTIHSNNTINNYCYIQINNDDDFKNIFNKKKDDTSYILKFNYNLNIESFAWLKHFMQKYKTLLIKFAEFVYPPQIIYNKKILKWVSEKTHIIVPKPDILMYTINNIIPYLPTCIKNGLFENAINDIRKRNNKQQITVNQVLHNLYTSNGSFDALRLFRFFLLNMMTFEKVLEYIRKFINSKSECPILSLNLEELFLAYHYPTKIFKRIVSDLTIQRTDCSPLFFNILKKKIIESGRDELIVDLYFFARTPELLKHIYNKDVLFKIIKQCIINNYKNFRDDIFQSGIYLRLYNIFVQYEQYKKKYAAKYKIFKMDVFSSFPYNAEFHDEIVFHESMLNKKSLKAKIVFRIFNNIISRKQYSLTKLEMYEKLFHKYYKKIKK